MNAPATESKGACQRCGEHIAFPASMAGQNFTCHHCGKETTLAASEELARSEPASILTDQKWGERIMQMRPGVLRSFLICLGMGWQLICIAVVLAFVAVFLFVALRLLHAAWGH